MKKEEINLIREDLKYCLLRPFLVWLIELAEWKCIYGDGDSLGVTAPDGATFVDGLILQNGSKPYVAWNEVYYPLLLRMASEGWNRGNHIAGSICVYGDFVEIFDFCSIVNEKIINPNITIACEQAMYRLYEECY